MSRILLLIIPYYLSLFSLLHSLLHASTSIIDDQSLCPASSAALAASKEYFGYPIEIYADQEPALATRTNDLFQCPSPEHRSSLAAHLCPIKPLYCPITKENLDNAFFRNDGRDCLRKKGDVINVVILGGSVTSGESAGGCCCSSAFDSRCSSLNQDCAGQQDSKTLVKQCSWVAYFERFLAQLGQQYVVVNLAVPGYTSTRSAFNVNHMLAARGVSLSSKDIVLIDHSVEPQVVYDQDYVYSTPTGIEALLRQLLYPVKMSCPAIVLLQMHTLHFSGLYQALARRYHVSMWSLKEIGLSEYAKDHQPNMLPYIKFLNNDIHATHNPPWHVHMFYADMISNLFKEKFHRNCTEGTPILYCRPRAIPWPLSMKADSSTYSACTGDTTTFLTADFTKETPDNSIILDRTSRKFWRHMQDPPGEFGLESQLEGGENEVRSLVIDIPPEVLVLPNDQVVMFQFTFRRTNLNAGVVQINICNRWISLADALWEKFETTFVVISMIKSFTFTAAELRTFCGEVPPFIVFEHYRHLSKTKEEHLVRTKGQRFRIETINICIPLNLD